MNLAQHMNLISRKVEKRSCNSKASYAVICSLDCSADQDTIWKLCTDPSTLQLWFGQVKGDFKVGGHYAVEGAASGVVTRCKPQEQFSLDWGFGDDVSWLSVSLESLEKNRVRLVIDHEAYAEGEHFKKHGPGASGVGWELWLTGLAEHLSSAKKIDVNAALETTAGKDLIRKSCLEWAEASKRAGYDAKEMDLAAEATRKFFTSET